MTHSKTTGQANAQKPLLQYKLFWRKTRNQGLFAMVTQLSGIKTKVILSLSFWIFTNKTLKNPLN
jgi:Na+(H+)/acetate symporter ActP